MPSLRPGIVVGCLLGFAGCAPNLADQASKAPAFEPPGETKCGVAKSQSEPLIVEWPSAARAKLEALTRTGVVAVRYTGCEMEVLASCNAPGKYGYTAITPKRDHLAIRNEDDLYANIPLGAARLEGKLARSGELDVDMSMVGRYASDQAVVRSDQLQGPDCEKATHVVSALTVGAFDFFAASGATVGGGVTVGNAGGGATQQAAKELLNSDGRMKSCDAATTSDKAPPDGCGAILRLEVVPLGEAKREAPAAKLGVSLEPSGPSAPVGGELAFQVPDRDAHYEVTVEAGGKTLTCEQPVTYYKPCRLTGLEDGKAHVTVRGTSDFQRDIRVSGEGSTGVQILHRGRTAEIVWGALTIAGGVATVVGFVNPPGLSSPTASDTGGDGAFLTNLLLVSIGGGLAVTGLSVYLASALSAHDGLLVAGPGGAELAGRSPIEWGGPLAPTTFCF